MDFRRAFEIVTAAAVEGGYSRDPNDKGNWTGGAVGAGELKGTKFGISAAAYPQLDIENLTIEAARLIYRRDHWDRLSIEALPAELMLPVFDMAVNQGQGTAAKTLQRAARVTADGVIGRLTIRAVWAAELETWCRFVGKRNRRYAESLGAVIGEYGEGWFIRAARIEYRALRAR